jgi:NitT/TauT family transport system permease protein
MSAANAPLVAAAAGLPLARRARGLLEALLLPLVTTAVAVGLWELVIVVFTLPAYVLPHPLDVFERIGTERAILWTNAVATGKIAALALVISAVAGVLLGLVIGWFRTVRQLLMPLLVALQSLPKIALAPIFVAWLGFGTLPKLLIAILITFFPITLAVIVGVENVSTKVVLLSRSMGLARSAFVRKILLPSVAPYAVASLTIAATLAVVGAIVAEFVGSQEGLGNLLLLASGNRDVPLVFAAIIVTALLGIVFYAVAALAGRLLTLRLGAPYMRGSSR